MEGNGIPCAAATVLETSENELINEYENKPKKKKRGPDKSWMERRNERAAKLTIEEELMLEDVHSYRTRLRMDEECFTMILDLIKDDIKKRDTLMRQAIKPDERLAITLKFFATGLTFRQLSCLFEAGERTISCIVKQVTFALIKKLKDTIELLKSTEEWEEIANEFSLLYSLPNCIGAIDAKQIVMQKPCNSGSQYCKHKSVNPIVILAVVDTDFMFRYVGITNNGCINDEGLWNTCEINKLLLKNELQIPDEEYLPDSEVKTPHYFAANTAFPLSPHLMTPFPEKSLTTGQRIFNHRLSEAKTCVESAFAILGDRFRLFRSTLNLRPADVKNFAMAACCLHNYLVMNSPSYIQFEEEINVSESGIIDITYNDDSNPSNYAEEIRDRLAHYFSTEAESV